MPIYIAGVKFLHLTSGDLERIERDVQRAVSEIHRSGGYKAAESDGDIVVTESILVDQARCNIW